MDGFSMLLWDAESGSWEELLGVLPEGVKRRLALDAIELCFDSFQPSFEQLFDQSTVTIAREALALLRDRIDADSLGVPVQGFFDNLYSIQERDHAPGAASIVMAISEYADPLPRGLAEADVLAIFSACYEAVLNSERMPRVSIQMERDNLNCVRLISRQRALIDEAVRGVR